METEARLEHALSLVQAGEFERALTEFRVLGNAAVHSESRVDSIYGELVCLTRLERPLEARQTLSVARKMFGDIDEMQARGDLIEVQIDVLEEDWHHALNLLQKMFKRYGEMLLHPQLRDVFEEVQWRRGILLAAFGKFREALPLLQESLNFKSLLTGDLYFQLGRCYFDSGDREHAREALTKALAMGLDDASASTAHFNLGTIFIGQEAYAKAVEELKIAETCANRARAPKTYIYKALATSYGKLGMHDEARHYAQLAGK